MDKEAIITEFLTDRCDRCNRRLTRKVFKFNDKHFGPSCIKKVATKEEIKAENGKRK